MLKQETQPRVTAIDAPISATHAETTLYQDGKARLRLTLKDGHLALDFIGPRQPSATAKRRIAAYFALFIDADRPLVALGVMKSEIYDQWSLDAFVALAEEGEL